MGELRRLQAGEPPEVGGYRLLGGIGDGGQGSVFLGEGPDGRRVAVKILHARLLGDQHAKRRFLQEGATAARVAAFSTAKVIETGLVEGRPYIVSEYVEGPSLQELVAREGPRADGAVERLAVGTAAALAAIHRAGIVHRDFKPSNVLIGPDGPRVIDFGIAKAMDAGTTASSVVGTPGYMSPEQIAGQPASPASDMFAWATTMAFAATGRALFAGESIPAVMHRILTAQPDLREIGEPLRSLLAACLDKEPSTRPSADDVLQSLLDGSTADDAFHAKAAAAARRAPRGPSHRARHTAPARRRRPIVVAGVGVALAGGLALGLAWQGDQTPTGRSGGGSAVGKAVTSASPASAFGRPLGGPFGTGEVSALAVGELNGSAVVAAAEVKTSRLGVWDPVKGKLLARMPQRVIDVGSLAFASVGDQTALVWATPDGRAHWWHPGGSAPVRSTVVCKKQPHMAVVQRPDGDAVVAGCEEGRIQGWDLATGKPSGLWSFLARGVTSVSSAGDGETVFAVGLDGRVQRWKPWAKQRPETITWAGGTAVHAVDQRMLAVQGRAGLDVVDFDSGRRICAVGSPPSRLASSRNLLIGAGEGVRAWNLRTCEPFATVTDSGQVGVLATGDAGGRPYAVASVDGKGLVMWSLDDVPAG
ncbi:WD40 repeat domain-containing serine/threonine protein kinase [Nonomuraea sp. bgisy101]|uniref:WD40 repeat domain-containing serine/threonine protein kinase n=1 Tax=Nonomuraea sp. bgisy101 TaxID=3413784 RepID=UPI003D734278